MKLSSYATKELFERRKPKLKKRGRKPVYDKKSILKPLKRIWLKANHPCSKRLKAILPIWLPDYIQTYGELTLPPKVDPGIELVFGL